MKEMLEIIGKVFSAPNHIAASIGWLTIGLVVLSRWPEYNFITKYIVTLVLTH